MEGGFIEGGGFFLGDEDGSGIEARGHRSAPQGQHGRVGIQLGQQRRPGCTNCSSLSWNEEYHRAFGVMLCNLCKRSAQLISKSNAKQRYHLTDNDLKQLGSLKKPNPQRKDWQPMHLYLQSQVEAVSHAKHGGEAGLEEHQQRLLDQKMQERVKKWENMRQKEEEDAARRDRIKRRMEEEDAERQQTQQESLRVAAARAGEGPSSSQQQQGAGPPAGGVEVEEI